MLHDHATRPCYGCTPLISAIQRREGRTKRKLKTLLDQRASPSLPPSSSVRKHPRGPTVDNKRLSSLRRRRLPQVEVGNLRELVDAAKEREGTGGLGVDGLRGSEGV